MVNIEIIIGIIFIAVLGAVFIPLAFDVQGNVTLSSSVLQNITQFDNFEWARANDFSAFATNVPQARTDTFSNYKVEILEYGTSPVGTQSATWTSAMPDPFPINATISITLYWYREDSSPPAMGTGVCWDISVTGVSVNNTMDITPNAGKTVCNASFTLQAIDDLLIENFNFTQTDHQLQGNDFVAIFIQRDTLNPADDWSRGANFLGLRIIWDTGELRFQ